MPPRHVLLVKVVNFTCFSRPTGYNDIHICTSLQMKHAVNQGIATCTAHAHNYTCVHVYWRGDLFRDNAECLLRHSVIIIILCALSNNDLMVNCRQNDMTSFYTCRSYYRYINNHCKIWWVMLTLHGLSELYRPDLLL